MEPVYLESPFGGDVPRNKLYARLASADCLKRGESPYGSHLYFTQPHILNDDDPAERALGIEAGFVWARLCKKSVFYVDFGMSRGMHGGLEDASRYGRRIEYRKLPDDIFTRFFEKIGDGEFVVRNVEKLRWGF